MGRKFRDASHLFHSLGQEGTTMRKGMWECSEVVSKLTMEVEIFFSFHVCFSESKEIPPGLLPKYLLLRCGGGRPGLAL